MFKVPEWEEDIPKSKLNFEKNRPKKCKQKNQKKKDTPRDILKQNTLIKPNFKTKIKLPINDKIKLVNNIKKSNIVTNGTAAIQNNKIENKVKKKKQRGNKQPKNTQHNLNVTTDIQKINAEKTNEKKAPLNNYKDEKTKEILVKESSNDNKLTIKDNKPTLIDRVTIKKTKAERKKELLKSILQKEGHRNHVNVSSGNALRDRMLERLKAAKFRYLNEKLYTSSGSEAQKLFQSDPGAFQTYHEGYQQQMKKWPVRPLDVIIKRIQKMPKTYKIADMGCGEAELSKRIQQNVRSFDLVANSADVEACDVSHTPLPAASIDVAVYCLALMGTDLTQYLVEANRVLRIGGHLLIAEVESRFGNVEEFTRDVQKLGFSLKKLDETHKVFFFMEFTKAREAPVKKAKLPLLTLKPCIYKKR